MEECAMTNTHATPAPFDLISWQVADSPTSLDVELEISGIRQRVRGHGPDRVAAFADAARRAGIRVALPHREVHEWDGGSGTVTTTIWCVVDDVEVEGTGSARERGEATMRAMIAAAVASLHTEMAHSS
jgi:hypothetical protein